MKKNFIAIFLVLCLITILSAFFACTQIADPQAADAGIPVPADLAQAGVVAIAPLSDNAVSRDAAGCFNVRISPAGPQLIDRAFEVRIADYDPAYTYTFTYSSSDYRGIYGGNDFIALAPLKCGPRDITVIKKPKTSGVICGYIYTLNIGFTPPVLACTPEGDMYVGKSYKFYVTKVESTGTYSITYSSNFSGQAGGTGWVGGYARAAGAGWAKVELKSNNCPGTIYTYTLPFTVYP